MGTKAFLPLLRASKGRVVNVASIAGVFGLPTQAAYCVSKHGVEAFSDDLKKDYGEDYYKFVRKMLSAVLMDLGNTKSELVPEAMMHALTDKAPKFRYQVGNDSKYLI